MQFVTKLSTVFYFLLLSFSMGFIFSAYIFTYAKETTGVKYFTNLTNKSFVLFEKIGLKKHIAALIGEENLRLALLKEDKTLEAPVEEITNEKHASTSNTSPKKKNNKKRLEDDLVIESL